MTQAIVITLGVIMADAFDTEQLLDCLEKLKSCLPIQIPVYDFKRHQRSLDMVRKVSFFFFFFHIPILGLGLAECVLRVESAWWWCYNLRNQFDKHIFIWIRTGECGRCYNPGGHFGLPWCSCSWTHEHEDLCWHRFVHLFFLFGLSLSLPVI